MNWVLIILGIILIWRIAEGYKRGMVKEIISFVSLLVLCITLILLGNALNHYFEKDIIKMIVSIILLIVLAIGHRLLSLIFFSAKIVSKLPVIRSMNKLLGVVVGILETILIAWTVYAWIMFLGMGMIGQQILLYAKESKILTILFEYNYLARVLESVLTFFAK